MRIGIIGRINSGKSTLANILVRDYDFTEYTFADPIKDMLCVLLRMTREDFEVAKRSNEDLLNIPNLNARKLLQTLGTEWGRDTIHPDIWINSLKSKILNNKSKNIVISDVRFENEFKLLQELDFKIIKIKSKFEEVLPIHESEKFCDYISDHFVTIYNYKDIQDLENQVKLIFKWASVSETERSDANWFDYFDVLPRIEAEGSEMPSLARSDRPSTLIPNFN